MAFPQALHRLAPAGGPLVGRAAEMGALRRAWVEARHGDRCLVLLAGEAGVGKSRLAAELAGKVEAEGAAVAFGACPAGGADPYHPLVEALGALPAGYGDRDAMLHALAAGAAARARRVPMLLVLDDLHRAGRSTLLAVSTVVEAAAGSPMLVVGTYRDTALDRSHPLGEFLAAMVPRPGVERIAVDGLTPEAIVAMVGDDELARRVWRQSEGNPVRVNELLRLGALDRPLPPAFDELVARRLDDLTPAARSLIEAAAVAGSDFRVDVVATAAGVPQERAATAMKQLVAAGFVVGEVAGPAASRRFTHDMVRETIDRQLDASVRVRLHLRIGTALERPEGSPAPAALLAWHFRAASPVGGSAAALRHSVRAGDTAMELLAWEEAAVHYGHALASAAGAGPSTRADLLLSLGEAQRLAGETVRARRAFLEAAMLSRPDNDGPQMTRVALALARVGAVWGEDAELEGPAGENPGPLGTTASVDFASDALYDVLDGVGPAVAPAPTVVHAGTGPAQAAGGALLRARHVALAGPEHAAARFATADEVVGLASGTGDDELAVTGLGWRLADALELGRIDQVVADRAAHAEVALRLNDPRHVADAAAWSAMHALLEGRVEDARAAAADAYELAVEAGDPEADDSYLIQCWWLALEWGTPGDLSEVADECRSRASTGPAAAAGGWRAATALALARAGRLDPAAAELQGVTDNGLGGLLRDTGRVLPLTCVAEVAWTLGDGYRAATVGPMLEPFADRLVVAGRALVCGGSVARACGLVAASACRWDEAERHFERALAVHRGLGALPLLARTRFEWSKVLLERGRKGDKRRSADSRRKSAELASRLGMARLLEEIAGPAT